MGEVDQSGQQRTAATLAWFAAFVVPAVLWTDPRGRGLTALLDARAGRGEGTTREAPRARAGPLAVGAPAEGVTTEEGDPDEAEEIPSDSREDLPPSAPARPIENPCVRAVDGRCEALALDGFHRALERVARRTPGAMARVLLLGDSVVAGDHLASRLRRRLQDDYGDGGPGWVFASPPSRWNHHRDVTVEGEGWRVRSVVVEPFSDGAHGLGGAAFEPARERAVSRVTLRQRARRAVSASRLELWYLLQPGGGALTLSVDGGEGRAVPTESASAQAGWFTLPVPERARTFELRATGAPSRVFGWVLERAGPGVVLDNLGLVGATAATLARHGEDHWRAQLTHRAPDLVVVLLGANEAHGAAGSVDGGRAQRQLQDLLARVRGARPEASCLVLAPLDQAGVSDGELATRTAIPTLAAAHRRAALGRGCAFWDTFAWMGGRGSAVRWRRWRFMEPDYTHPTGPGGARVADALYEALRASRSRGRPGP